MRVRCYLCFALGAPGVKGQEANKTITELHLGDNKIGSDGAVALANALKALLVLCVFPLVRVTCSCCGPANRLTIDALVHFRFREFSTLQ